MILIYSFILSFTITYISMPYFIGKLKDKNITTKDKYKLNSPSIPDQGASIVLFSSLITITLYPLLVRILNRISDDYSYFDLETLDFIILSVILLFAFFGIVDDILDLSWTMKIFIPISFSFPLSIGFVPSYIDLPFLGKVILADFQLSPIDGIDLSDFFKFVVIPIYVMVVANLVNMHSGFNGLQSGLSSILLFSLLIKCYLESQTDNLSIFYIILGGLFVLYLFNKYPAKIFEGNIGSLAFGASIGILIVIKNFYLLGIIILIPHILDFFLFLYSKFYLNEFIKFGELHNNGQILAPSPYKLKFLFPYYFKLSEKQSVKILHSLTGLFCFFGILFF